MIYHEFSLSSHHQGIDFAVDLRFEQNNKPKPLVIFSHGFKSFKDWGPFNLMAESFARAGFIFAKFNFSHNGTTLGYPQDFVDLEAFAQNNFSIELDDLGHLIDYFFSTQQNSFIEEYDLNQIYLLGHSRGATLSILKACEDKRIRAVSSWAGVSDYSLLWSPQELQEWKKRGVIYVMNKRTGQRMPMYYQIIENYYKNRERLDLCLAIDQLKVPLLLVHAIDDHTVPIGMAYEIKKWTDKATLYTLEQGGHCFGSLHPHYDNFLPTALKSAIEQTQSFFSALNFQSIGSSNEKN